MSDIDEPGDEIEIVRDRDGIAVFGERNIVERFLETLNLTSREISLSQVGPKLQAASGITQAVSEATANSAQWVKLTKESAAAFSQAVRGQAGLKPMKGSNVDVVRGIVTRAKDGQTDHIVQILKSSVGSTLSNPAMLAGAAGVMAQLAMQQTFDEITSYLQRIDQKVDDIALAQKNAAIAPMMGVEMIVLDAMTTREQVGRVSEVTWSKVEHGPQTIATAQAYAVKELQRIADKTAKQDDVGNLADLVRESEPEVREWLSVIAHSVRLQDALGILELDRVLDASPEELDRHREALQISRQNRVRALDRVSVTAIETFTNAAKLANTKALLNPFDAPTVVKLSNATNSDILDFRRSLGIETDVAVHESRRWADAASELGEQVILGAVSGAAAVGSFGMGAVDRAAIAFTPVDLDGDGVPDKSPAQIAAEQAGDAARVAVSNVAGFFGSLFNRKDSAESGDKEA